MCRWLVFIVTCLCLFEAVEYSQSVFTKYINKYVCMYIIFMHDTIQIYVSEEWWSRTGLSIEGTVVQSHLLLFRNLGNFVYVTLPVSFGRDTKSRWSLLSGVYARGSKRSHTGGKCVTCSGLTNSREGQL